MRPWKKNIQIIQYIATGFIMINFASKRRIKREIRKLDEIFGLMDRIFGRISK